MISSKGSPGPERAASLTVLAHWHPCVFTYSCTHIWAQVAIHGAVNIDRRGIKEVECHCQLVKLELPISKHNCCAIGTRNSNQHEMCSYSTQERDDVTIKRLLKPNPNVNQLQLLSAKDDRSVIIVAWRCLWCQSWCLQQKSRSFLMIAIECIMNIWWRCCISIKKQTLVFKTLLQWSCRVGIG